MKADSNYQRGHKGTCGNCKRAIVFNGLHWDHVGGKMRHPIRPIPDEYKTLTQEQYNAIRLACIPAYQKIIAYGLNPHLLEDIAFGKDLPGIIIEPPPIPVTPLARNKQTHKLSFGGWIGLADD